MPIINLESTNPIELQFERKSGQVASYVFKLHTGALKIVSKKIKGL